MTSPRLQLDLNRADYFAQRGAMVMTDRATLTNLDNLSTSPDRSPHLSPRNRQPTFVPSPSNNGRYPPTIIKPEIAGFGYYQDPTYSFQPSPIIKPSPRYQPNYPDNYAGQSSPHSLSRVPSQSYAPGAVIKPIQSMQPNAVPTIPIVYSKSHPKSMQSINFDYQIRQPTYQQSVYQQPTYNYKSDLDRKFEEQYRKLNKIATDFEEQYSARQKISQMKLDTELRQLEMMKYSEQLPNINRNRPHHRKVQTMVPDSHRQSPVYKKMYTEEDFQLERRQQQVRYRSKPRGYDAEQNYYQEKREHLPVISRDEEESPYFETVRRPKHQVYSSVNMGDSREIARSQLKPRTKTFVGSQPRLNDDDDEEPVLVPVRTVRVRVTSKQEDRRRAIQVISLATPFDTKKKTKLRLRAYTWTIVYSILLRNSVKQKVLVEREGFLQNISQNISSIYGLLETFIKQTAGFQIEKLLTSKKPAFTFISNKKPIPENKMEAECSALTNDLKTMISNVVLNIRSLSTYFFTLLATLSEEGSLVPNDYFTEFELKRQQFSYFGKLKFITPERSKFIIGGLILRVFIHNIVMKPWEFFKLESSKFDQERVLNIGSVIYNIIMDVLRDLAPPFEDNQSFLPVELKVRPKKMLAQALEINDTSANIVKPLGKGKEEIIEGFYSKEQLACLFTNRKKQIDEVKKWVIEWLDRFYENSHKEMVKALENQNR